MTIEIDWTSFDKYSEQNCTCECETDYRTHAKYIAHYGLIARKPCPTCGSNKLKAARTDWEGF